MRTTIATLTLSLALGCGGSPGAKTPAPKPSAAQAAKPAEAQLPPLQRGLKALAQGHAQEAHKWLTVAAAEPAQRPLALLALARWALLTGQYAQAAAPIAEKLPPELQAEHTEVRAEALRAQGQLQEAVALLGAGQALPERASARLLLGEVLLELGRADEAQLALMSLIEDYNEGRVAEGNARALAEIGRAAYLLRSPEDANEAFNESELAGSADLRTLLWRAEVYLENHDPGHAEEVVNEALALAPAHPDALVWMALVQLEQALDFEAATGLVNTALKTNPNAGRAHAVLASIALRDLQIDQVEKHLQAALQVNARDLHALSLRGTARFLADDRAGFDQVKAQVFGLNKHYTRFYQTVGQYADWEHRYEEIVQLMQEALTLDDDNADAHAQLGINLIRGGDDKGGVRALQRAFAKDPYNVRVFNTLKLYEQVIPQSYSEKELPPFRWRFPTDEQAVLERTLPPVLASAWQKMRGFYAFTPSTPVGIELYAERENFAIRTSGLPRTAIQGVCFGKTLASLTPRNEQFNLAMTLWHELAHVFHIQMSRSRVPRWFTEGLAEYETLVERPEWRREQDAELFLALRDGRLPKLRSMNQAFTHAEDISDIAVAYYASSQIVKMLAENYGRPALRRMLELWGQGVPSDQVLVQALGKSPEQLDVEVQRYLQAQLQRYNTQFLPSDRIGDPRAVQERVEQHPNDATAWVKVARLHLRAGSADLALTSVSKALELDPKQAEALFLKAQWSLRQGNELLADALLSKLLELKHDGYEVQLLRARIAAARQQMADVSDALAAAHVWDPSQAEPLWGLLDFAVTAEQRLPLLQKLAEIEEHRSEVYSELSALLLAKGQLEPALHAAHSAVHAGAETPAAHTQLARTLAQAGQHAAAAAAFDTALLCPAAPQDLAAAHQAYAEYLRARGQTQRAQQLEQRAAQLNAQPSAPAP